MKKKESDWFKNEDPDVQLGLDYEETGGEAHKYFVELKSKRAIDIAKRHFGPSKKICCIDIGCGTGETCYWLAKDFKMVEGVDYAKSMIGLAQQKDIKRCRFHVADSSGLAFDDETFDIAVFFNVWHHIESKKILNDTISEAKRVVKKGGLVINVDLNPYNPVTRHVVNTYEIDSAVTLDGLKKGIFPTTFRPGECIEALERHGLDVRFKEFMAFFPRHFAFLLPVEKLLKKIPVGGLYLVAGVKS